jgi:hypothetical protein
MHDGIVVILSKNMEGNSHDFPPLHGSPLRGIIAHRDPVLQRVAIDRPSTAS